MTKLSPIMYYEISCFTDHGVASTVKWRSLEPAWCKKYVLV